MDVKILGSLEGAGLTPIEAKVYLALVEGGSSAAGDLSRRAGVHRRLAYDAVDRLIAKGLVGSITRNNRKLFEAAQPSRFLELMDERRARLTETVAQLDARWHSATRQEGTVLFEGKRGLKTVFEDQLRTKKEILIVGSGITPYASLKWYFKWFDERRKKANVPVRLIFDDTSRATIPAIPLAKLRFLPKQYIGPAAINIYGDTVALILWTEEPTAMVIRNKDMATSYRNFFDLLWKNAKE